ncbi:unnamed protein product [Dicrocoelium dendriticum]|nr:unnamed protein product [Dicrocoelium dendriticum]
MNRTAYHDTFCTPTNFTSADLLMWLGLLWVFESLSTHLTEEMSAEDSFSLSVTPKDVLYIMFYRRADSRVSGGNAVIQLHNDGKCKLHYKLESNLPELYYFQPRYDCLIPGQHANIVVYSLSYHLSHPSNGKQEILVRSMKAKNAEEECLSQLWQNANESQMRTHKLKCIPFVDGDVVIEPNSELVFDGPYALPFSSEILLTNTSTDSVYFDTLTSSTNLTVFPPEDTIWPKQYFVLLVIRKPMEAATAIATSDTITIRTAMFPFDKMRPTREMWSAAPKKDTIIKCVYKTPETSPSVMEFKTVKNWDELLVQRHRRLVTLPLCDNSAALFGKLSPPSFRL